MPYILSLYKQRSNFFFYESFPHTALVIWDDLKYTLLWWLHNFFLFCHLFWRHNLTGSVISSFQVLSHQDCHSLCIRHQRCSSHNHQYIKAYLHGTTLSHATKSYRVNRPLQFHRVNFVNSTTPRERCVHGTWFKRKDSNFTKTA